MNPLFFSPIYTVFEDTQIFSPEAITDAVGGYTQNFQTVATFALGGVLILSGIYVLFSFIRSLFH